MKRKLYTIGYTGFALDDFVQTLVRNGIQSLLDIREIPLSRKRGFSKTALRDRLYEEGISYEHLKALGSPKTLRHELRETRNYPRFFRGVQSHLLTEDANAELQRAIMAARAYRSCLMCCCPDWERCHRRCVVDAILDETHFAFEHLTLPATDSKFRAA